MNLTKKRIIERPQDMNSSQWEAVSYQDGHLLIIAGPGTGKTHTLTHRIAQTASRLNSHEKVLAVTFTNKAAKEMRARLKKIKPHCLQNVFAGTFHQFCLGVLAEAGRHDGFQVADEETVLEVSKVIWPDQSLRERKNILNRISNFKSSGFDQTIPAEASTFNHRLRRLNLLDYDDILLETYRLLKEDRPLRNKMHKQYRFIFVDEYQDINLIQHKLLILLAGSTGRVTAIGDPNQAIYGFRGSDSSFFHRFSGDFDGAKTHYLSDNYRSGKTILSASSQVMAACENTHVPGLTARIYARGRLLVHEAATDKAEAEYVVHQVEKMVGGTSMFSRDSARVGQDEPAQVGFGEIAVLFRMNSLARALKEAFERSGIPYHLSSAKTDDSLDDICPKRSYDVDMETEKVSLMTLHASKGLEFPVVFIVGCEDSILPLKLDGLSAEKQEERRLFYVGMTRAKNYLYLTHAKRRIVFGQRMNNPVSPFVLNIKEELKEQTKQEFSKRKQKQEEQISLF